MSTLPQQSYMYFASTMSTDFTGIDHFAAPSLQIGSITWYEMAQSAKNM